ncbi:hypothetical protein CABS01_17150 [Colletotrichum abscissum]|uniref:uncharacterized protein n=1 Tax=Colletotrichum abscissum TaxID=1671311 RepID=UPI0027D6ACE4|nr:uncharacterized protein CABS01_17150 [Colletotrichum abscissum]KAK1489684.1 hypothetical protein CABS01_17150 [Colletotrichum abscissum]
MAQAEPPLGRERCPMAPAHTTLEDWSGCQIPANDDYPPLGTDRGLLLCAGSFGCYQETLREGGKRLDWCLLQFKHSDRLSTIVVILDDCAVWVALSLRWSSMSQDHEAKHCKSTER